MCHALSARLVESLTLAKAIANSRHRPGILSSDLLLAMLLVPSSSAYQLLNKLTVSEQKRMHYMTSTNVLVNLLHFGSAPEPYLYLRAERRLTEYRGECVSRGLDEIFKFASYEARRRGNRDGEITTAIVLYAMAKLRSNAQYLLGLAGLDASSIEPLLSAELKE